MMRYLTAGESHGPKLTAIIEGIPAGLIIDVQKINEQLARRQLGYGRGGRMRIEKDRVEITSGLRWGQTLGTPLTLVIENKDWPSWQEKMAPVAQPPEDAGAIRVTQPRPGHADLAGAIKYNFNDIRNVLERSSARETAIRTALGAVARILLAEVCPSFAIISYVTGIGEITSSVPKVSLTEKAKLAADSEVACPDAAATEHMKRRIDEAKKNGDSLGGIVELEVAGLPVGLGSHVHWDRRLDGLLAGALMSIPAIKGVEIGAGFQAAARPGSAVHDEIFYELARGYYRKTNNAGGIEGGMTNGENLLLRLAMKPIPTLYQPLRSVDILSKEAVASTVERSDTCAVPAAGVVAEAVVCLALANVLLEKFGGDEILEIKRNYQAYEDYVQKR